MDRRKSEKTYEKPEPRADAQCWWAVASKYRPAARAEAMSDDLRSEGESESRYSLWGFGSPKSFGKDGTSAAEEADAAAINVVA